MCPFFLILTQISIVSEHLGSVHRSFGAKLALTSRGLSVHIPVCSHQLHLLVSTPPTMDPNERIIRTRWQSSFVHRFWSLHPLCYVKSQQTRLTRSDRGASTQTEAVASRVTLAGHRGGPRRSWRERRSLLLLPVSTHSDSVAPMQKDQTHSQRSVKPHCPLLAHTRTVRMDFNTVEPLVEEQNTPSAQETNQNRENINIEEELKIKQVWALHDGGGGLTAGGYWGG